jgi:hypothetical protein
MGYAGPRREGSGAGFLHSSTPINPTVRHPPGAPRYSLLDDDALECTAVTLQARHPTVVKTKQHGEA